METLWRWTSSVFLILTLNIGYILSQNMGPNCPLPALALQEGPMRDCNPGLLNPQLQMNNLFSNPPNGLAPGTPAQECQRSSYQDRLCTQSTLNQQANVVPLLQSPCADLGLLNTQAVQSSSYIGAPGPAFNIPGKLLPQNQCPIESPISPCLRQQNLGLSSLEMLPPLQGTLMPFAQGGLPSPCSPLTGPCSSLYSNRASILSNHFTPLVPIVNSGLPAPCIDVPPPQGTALQPLPGPISPASQINCSPQSPVFNPQCDVLPETQPCPAAGSQNPASVGSTFRNSLPLSPFMFPRPTLFPSIAPLQYITSPCDLNYADTPTSTTNLGSLCANPGLTQYDSICPQAPIISPTFVPNILPGLSNQNIQLFPLQSSSVSQPPLNSPCSLTTDLASIHVLPSPLISQSCAIPPNSLGDLQVAPLNVSPPCLKNTLPPMLPSFSNGPIICDSSSLCQPALNTVPIPINLQISVPPPIVPAPKITIINTTPALDTTTTAQEPNFFDLPYPLPPIIIDGKRSRSRSWLPLVLVALFARDGNNGGCLGNSDPIPIPYPIPIPTNNPVVVNK